MIKYDLLRQYNHVVDGIRFIQPMSPKTNPYLITYFSENSTFLEDYDKLKLKIIDVRVVIVPRTTIPRTWLTQDLIKEFKSKTLFPIPSTAKPPTRKNLIYDISYYLKKVDEKYKPSHYRQRAGKFILSSVFSTFLEYPDYRKVLLYSININKPFNKFIDRKMFPIVNYIKENNLYFDDLILVLIDDNGAKYRSLIKNRKYQFDRVYRYIKLIKSAYQEDIDDIDLEKDEIEDATNKIHNNVLNNIKPEKNEIIKTAIHDFVSKDKKTRDQILNKPIDQDVVNKVASAAIIHKVSGDIPKAKLIVNRMVKRQIASKKLFQVIDKNLTDQILERPQIKEKPENPLFKAADIIEIVDNKIPTHLFQKRQVDFESNLKNDIVNSFAVLEEKEFPLKIEHIDIVDKPERKNEIDKSDISLIRVTLIGENNQKHQIKIEIPKIDPNSGTFRVNGKRKCLINQIILCPITFPKKYDSKFESSYSQFHIHSKRTRNKKYLDIYIAGIKNMSLLIVMAYCFGFDETIKKFGISYEIVDKKPKKEESFSKISENKFILFKNIDNELKQELVDSLNKHKIETYEIKQEFGTKEYFNDLINSISERRNSTYRINTSLENIVDPVAKQVLINKQLPIKLDDIMYYMASKVVEGYTEKRNDLSNQRIRGSEVIVHLLQKQILAEYTVYKQQTLSGNKDAKFEINQNKVLSQFINSEIVANMEYANPVEEMATMTRISPVGKSIGGIPDKMAIQIQARNVHPSYFGNIDPLDTPEGENIGITQQLTIDALITSKRGLFANKEIEDKEGSGILSTSSAMIPFVENNDGNRVMMAVNQSRQMVPLKNPTPPVVKSGYESILTNVLSDSFIKRSPFDGRVLKATSDAIILLNRNGNQEVIDLTPVHLKSGSGKDTLSVFNVKVKTGQLVKNGQVLAEGSCIEGGEIALGRTLLTGLMPYKGYNFEDGIVINEKLIENDKLTSLHGIIEEVLVSEKDRVTFLCNQNEYIEKGQPLLKKSIGEIEELLGFDEEDETADISGQLFIKKSPGGRVVDIEVFCNTDPEKFPLLQELIYKTRKKYGLVEKDKFVVKGRIIQGILIKFKIEQELKIELTDKLCNRYGNKGIISLIESDENMPRTPWGETLDIILNPLGVIGRMNLGQIYELYCGLIAKEMGYRIIKAKSKAEIIKLYNSILPLLDGSPNKKFSKKLVANLSKLSNPQFNLLIEDIKKTGFSPIIIPPFKAPSSSQIYEALKIMNLKPGYQLYLPEYNVKTMNEVPVGYIYISKLEHLGAMKIHSRSTGPVTSKYMQPTAGKSREGGQRMGEADTYAIMSYNCPALLGEFFGPLSDDMTAKNKIIEEILHTGSAEYQIPQISPVKELLASYFISLMLQSAN